MTIGFTNLRATGAGAIDIGTPIRAIGIRVSGTGTIATGTTGIGTMGTGTTAIGRRITATGTPIIDTGITIRVTDIRRGRPGTSTTSGTPCIGARIAAPSWWRSAEANGSRPGVAAERARGGAKSIIPLG
jgi:hypothetical protein